MGTPLPVDTLPVTCGKNLYLPVTYGKEILYLAPIKKEPDSPTYLWERNTLPVTWGKELYLPVTYGKEILYLSPMGKKYLTCHLWKRNILT